MIAALMFLMMAAGAAPAAPEYPGGEAPLLAVDRFSDAAATLLRRSAGVKVPGPNEPIRLDDSVFVIHVTGPSGREAQCYDLDVRPATAGRLYVFYDDIGNYKLGQFPVVDLAPGDAGYSDLWDVWKVTVPPGFKINALRDMATVEKLLADPASGYTAARTGVLVNGPIVPEGSGADLKAGGGGRTSRLYLWYRGRRAPYLYFEGSIRAEEGVPPISEMAVAPEALAAGGRGATAKVAALPGDPGYSPLRRMTGPDGKPGPAGMLNCPVVSR